MAKIDEQISYNWLFFLLAGAFGAVTFWAVYDETATRREYKNYQEAFFKIETDLAEKSFKEKKAALEKNPEYQKLVAEKKQIETDLAGSKKQAFNDAKAKLQELEFVAFDKRQTFTFTKSNLDEEYYYFTKAKHEAPGSKEFEEHAKKLHNFEEKLKKDDEEATKAEKTRDDQQKIVDSFTDRLHTIDKTLEKLRAESEDAERKYEAAKEKQGGIFGPATEVIQQNIEDINKVDRCESCHTGTNRGGFETVTPKYYRSHPFRRTLFALHPVEKFGCTTCHDGQGRATTKFYAHAPTDNPHDAEKHFWEEPLLKGPFMQSNCRKCHTEEYELRAQLRCESQSECPGNLKCDVPSQPLNPSDTSIANFLPETLNPPAKEGAPQVEQPKYCVNPDNQIAEMVNLAPNLSKGRKIIEEVACYGCHPIEGYEKKPKAGPDLRHVRNKINAGWMVEWIKNPKAVHKNTRMPNFFPEQLHPEDYPKTAFPVRDDRSKNPNEPWKWTIEQQTGALASFLMSQSTAFEVQKMPGGGDAKHGKELFLTLGCRGCHNVTYDEKDPAFIDHKNRASHYDHGPMLGDTGSKTNPDWIYTWLKDPKSYAPGTRMPNLRLSDEEARDLATFIGGNKANREFPEPVAAVFNPGDKEWVKSGEKLMGYYGCYGCHFINGYEQTPGIGAELTEFGLKETSRLDYGDYIVNHRQQTWDAWLENKLKHPRVYRYERVDTRMPQFDLQPEEVTNVMVVLKGMRGKELAAEVRGHKLAPIEQQRERGRELVRWFNCYGCHIVDGYVGDIRQAQEYQGDKQTFAPPNITGEGAKTQPPWLFGFLKNVIRLRPWLNVRMPTFGFEDEQATSIVAMFSAMDHAAYPYSDFQRAVVNTGPKAAIGAAMFENLKCKSCHVVGDVKLTPEEAQKAAPNLLMAKSRLRPEWIVKWLSNPDWIQPGTRMPSFWSGGTNLLQALLGTPDGKKNFGGLPGIEQVADSALHQMEVVRNHVFTLEGGATATTAKPAGKKKASVPGKKKASLN
jgi:cytochrome c2